MWIEKAQLSFEDLKVALTHAHVLICLDFSRSFIVEANASGKALGAILRHEHGVIAFEIRKFDAKELNYHIYDREMLAMQTFKKFAPLSTQEKG